MVPGELPLCANRRHSYSHMWDITAAMEVPASFFFEGLARALNDAA